jgi:hypothetical protein
MTHKCLVSLIAATCLTTASGPQAAFLQPGGSHQATHSMSGGAQAAAPTSSSLYVRVKPLGGNAHAVLGAAAGKKNASMGAVWIVFLIYAIYFSVFMGILALLLPSGCSAIDEPEIVPVRPKMKKPRGGGAHPLLVWLWPQPRPA